MSILLSLSIFNKICIAANIHFKTQLYIISTEQNQLIQARNWNFVDNKCKTTMFNDFKNPSICVYFKFLFICINNTFTYVFTVSTIYILHFYGQNIIIYIRTFFVMYSNNKIYVYIYIIKKN